MEVLEGRCLSLQYLPAPRLSQHQEGGEEARKFRETLAAESRLPCLSGGMWGVVCVAQWIGV